MKRTTVYLSEDDREGLRRLSLATGKSQATLIREALRRRLARPVGRQFFSMAKGCSSGTEQPRISRAQAEALYRKKMGL